MRLISTGIFRIRLASRNDWFFPIRYVMVVLAGSGLSLTQASSFSAENRIAAREFPITADAPRQHPVP
jgi:hypothetical protein